MKIDLNQIIELEETELEDVQTTREYLAQLEYVDAILTHHISRCRIHLHGHRAIGPLCKFLDKLDLPKNQTLSSYHKQPVNHHEYPEGLDYATE